MADIPGKYIHEKTGSHYIELKADGSYFLFDGSTGIAGIYEVNGSDIRISVGESTSQGKIQDGIITDDEGEKWVRADSGGNDLAVLKCFSCGSDVPENAKFCSNCGTQVGKVEATAVKRDLRSSKQPQLTRANTDPLASMTWVPAALRKDDFPWELIEAAGGIVLMIILFIVASGHRP